MRGAASKELILAAGGGSRLGTLTKDRPKPLLQLLCLSLVERAILTARDAGISEFVIVVGYLEDKIRGKLENDGRYGAITFFENDQWQLGLQVWLDSESWLKRDTTQRLISIPIVSLDARWLSLSRTFENVSRTWMISGGSMRISCLSLRSTRFLREVLRPYPKFEWPQENWGRKAQRES